MTYDDQATAEPTIEEQCDYYRRECERLTNLCRQIHAQLYPETNSVNPSLIKIRNVLFMLRSFASP